ncbi:response regulator [Magnetospirillum sulfuroxidans]|uniref:Response regulator n=1 Tax=Magnetospirillum sulfuroxidans TaxID=611300 RepID=A0ABS5IHJ3_9PROT|nr:response regulator [Magnetospirillum sulfuroxidans]MBR9973869.1 response regulator [Magnetospirillum sulfuroxidans]
MAYVLAPQLAFGADFSRCRPLVFDPYLSNRRLLRDILSDLGCDGVLDCGRTRDAITNIESEQPNILFLDWSDQVDAVDFLRHLRANGNPHRFLPVVVMTAYSGLTHIAAARDAGANEFMLRPWSQHVVASRLRSIVEHPRLFIQGGGFFGPDRRRRRLDFQETERRRHENWRSADRRDPVGAVWDGPERRQGRPGFEPLERRDAPRV